MGAWNRPGAKIAIVGGGVSGLVTAYMLCADYEVQVFDATVYGGMQFALGLLFLWPLVRADSTPWMLATCLVVHASLVLFRTPSLLLYANVAPITYVLASVEWAVFLSACLLSCLAHDSAASA